MSEAKQTPDVVGEDTGQAPPAPARPWVTPTIETHQAKELTKSGGFVNTDFGPQPFDCS